jgi:hypothetical protein
MRIRGLAALALISLPLLSYGQSTLNFPRVLQPGEYSTTGYAIVNPESSSAAVTFTLFDADGEPQATTPQTIPARGQLARLGRELFPTAAGSGWVQAQSATNGLQGFWFGGDLTTFADGAEAAESSNDLVLPLVGPDSEIHLANTGTADVTLRLKLLGTDGFELAEPFLQHVPSKGFFRGNMALMFPTLTDLSLPSHMRISCPCPNASPVAAMVIARNLQFVAPSWIVSNGIPTATTSATIHFPYLVEGPQTNANWRSVIGLTNLSASASNNVMLTFVPDTGGVPRTHQHTLPPNGGSRFSARDLFALTSGFQSGWVRVTSTNGLPITGYIAYSDSNARGVAVVPAQLEGASTLLFAHIADLAPWLTGIALLNTNADVANVELFAITPTGALIGSSTLSLPPGSNRASLLRDLVPQTQSRSSDGGFVFLRSNLPVYGIELFFSRDLQVLANVAAGKLPPGFNFVPPPR